MEGGEAVVCSHTFVCAGARCLHGEEEGVHGGSVVGKEG